VVQKEELLNQVWKDAYVEEGVVAQNVFALRRALGTDPHGRKYIETIPRFGYRFIADVQEILKDNSELVLHETTKARILIQEEVENGEKPNQTLFQVPAPSKPFTRPRNLVIALVALSLAVVPILLYTRSLRTHDSNIKGNKIAVLPFKALGTDDSDESLGLGMADALIVKLSHSQDLSVIPTSSVFRFSGRDRDLLEVSRQLGADTVLDGTTQRVGERVRVTAQLVRVRDGQLLWSGTYDERFTDIFALQDAISEQMSQALTLHVPRNDGDRPTKKPTSNPEAYQAYLMGLYFWNKRTKIGLTKAIEYFQQAIARDSNYALAYAGLADSYYLLAYYRYDTDRRPNEAYENGKAASLKAIELDPNLGQAHMEVAMFQWTFDKDLSGAQVSFERATALDPNDATTHLRFGWFYIDCKGQLQEGIGQMRRAHELDPLSPAINSALSSVLIYARQYDEAIGLSKKAIELNPDLGAAYLVLGTAYELKERYPEALTEYDKALHHDDSQEYVQAYIAHTYAMMGRKTDATSLVMRLRLPGKGKSPKVLYCVALIYSALNDRGRAFAWLDKAITAHACTKFELRYDPELDVLRSDQRFNDILRRHNLDEIINQS
jgi:TolB-like protein/tetratricopeptide (TPR) repeat protein